MDQITIPELRNQLSRMRAEGALDTEIVVAWHQATETLPDPSPETDLAHHQVNAIAHDLGIGAASAQWWRHPTSLGKHTRDPGAPEPLPSSGRKSITGATPWSAMSTVSLGRGGFAPIR